MVKQTRGWVPPESNLELEAEDEIPKSQVSTRADDRNKAGEEQV